MSANSPNSSHPCPDVKTLAQLATGGLGGDAARELQSHLSSCPHCLQTFASIKDSSTVLVETRKEPAQDTDDVDENARRRFEADWRAGNVGPIDGYLPAKDDTRYLATLEELVLIDMEFRHKAWSKSGGASESPLEANAYATQFPALRGGDVLRRLSKEFANLRERYKAPPQDLPAPGLSDAKDATGASEMLGVFRLGPVLGVGGMGIVYRATDTQLQRDVAIKVMKPEFAGRPDAKARFLREAQAAARLNHDHVVAIHHVGEDHGIAYLTMPLLEGETLDDRLKREERLLPAEVVRLGKEIAEGLAAAHDIGLVHRDIKPANVWLEKKNGRSASRSASNCALSRARIMDFGLAKPAETDVKLTASGMLIGTPAYMAPEQARGEDVDGRSDLFSLGVLLYRAATGKLPFQTKDTMSALMSLALDTPPAPTKITCDVPEPLSNLILSLLAKVPGDRPQSAHQVVELLSALEQGPMSTQVPVPLATNAAEPKKPRGRWAWAIAAAALVPILALAAAPVILRLQTPEGEFRIEADDPDTVAEIDKLGGLTLKNQKTNRTFTVQTRKTVPLPVGDYELVVSDGQGLEFSTRTFSIKDPKSSASVKVTFTAKEGPVVPDQEKPFVLKRKAGDTVETGSLKRALELIQDGDTLEIRGNGPFLADRFQLKGKDLIVRAGSGYRPQLRVADASYFLQADDCSLNIEGCDFRAAWVGGSGSYLFNGGGRPWSFKNCRFLIGSGPVLGYRGPKLSFTDCMILAPFGFGGESWIVGAGPESLEVVNCIARVPNPLIPVRPPGSPLKVVLERNTILSHGSFFPPEMKEWKDNKVEVIAKDNIFQVNETYSNLLYTPHALAWRQKVAWNGNHNLYVGPPQSLEIIFDKDGKKRGHGIPAWTELWGKAEPGSREEAWIYPAWREFQLPREPAGVIKIVKPVVDDMRVRSKLPNLGPDWSLVGPGDAYVRALAAQGKPVAKDQLRPAPIEGAEFVLTRGGKVVKEFSHLRDAALAADDGDVIEIRTDDPIKGKSFSVKPETKTLTIKAAPGYRPVVESPARWLAAGLSLSVEGLHFLNTNFNLNDWAQTPKGCRLARMMNCSVAPPLGVIDNYWGVGDTWSFVTAADQGTEIVNCLIPGSIHMRLTPGGRTSVRNSFVGYFNFAVEEKAGKHAIDIDRSVIWLPAASAGALNVFSSGGTWDLKGPFVLPEFSIRDTMIDNATALSVWGNKAMKIGSWKGERNLYRLGEQRWYSIAQINAPLVNNLADWRKLWSSDADSVQLDPQLYDPRTWRLVPGSGGEGFGADVTKIGTLPR